MALTSANYNYERLGRGDLYLAARPTADPGTDFTTRAHGYKSLFYLAGDTGTALKAGVKAYANLTAGGVSVKAKQNVVEFDPNNGPKHPMGISDTQIDLEFEFADADPAHIADMFNLKAEELVSIAAAAGRAGRKLAFVGGQSVLIPVVACYRMPAQLVPGQYENHIFPRLLLTGDADLKLNKKDAITMKVKASALPDTYLVNSDGFGESWIIDVPDAAPL